MKKISRRDFLKTTALFGSAAMLAACKPAATAVVPTATTAAPAAAKPNLPFAVEDAAVNPFGLGTDPVDGVFFAGGFGDDYIKYAAKLEEQLHPGTTVSVQSIQKITEQLQPRFVAGNPPDVIDNSGANMIKMADLVSQNQLMDLAELMNAPALDTPGKKFGETLFAGSQDSATFGGKLYGLNISYTIQGIWYSKPAFEKAGYTYPKYWADMLTLCEQIKKDGKAAPWTYQGKYPYYIFGIVMNMLIYYSESRIVAMSFCEPRSWTRVLSS